MEVKFLIMRYQGDIINLIHGLIRGRCLLCVSSCVSWALSGFSLYSARWLGIYLEYLLSLPSRQESYFTSISPESTNSFSNSSLNTINFLCLNSSSQSIIEGIDVYLIDPLPLAFFRRSRFFLITID